MIVFQSTHCVACAHTLKKYGEETSLGEDLGLQLISNSPFTDNWQMTHDVTDNWHLHSPLPPSLPHSDNLIFPPQRLLTPARNSSCAGASKPRGRPLF